MAKAEQKSPVDREIATRERRIKRLQEQKDQRKREYEDDVASIDKKISEEKVLLDAMKRGQL